MENKKLNEKELEQVTGGTVEGMYVYDLQVGDWVWQGPDYELQWTVQENIQTNNGNDEVRIRFYYVGCTPAVNIGFDRDGNVVDGTRRTTVAEFYEKYNEYGGLIKSLGPYKNK